MKRLLRISFDLSLLSFIPIILWFFLGIIVDKNLINIFTLTYPLQFIFYIFRSVFSSGADLLLWYISSLFSCGLLQEVNSIEAAKTDVSISFNIGFKNVFLFFI